MRTASRSTSRLPMLEPVVRLMSSTVAAKERWATPQATARATPGVCLATGKSSSASRGRTAPDTPCLHSANLRTVTSPSAAHKRDTRAAKPERLEE